MEKNWVKDPFQIYGHGLNALFRMLRMLSLFFILITLLCGPTLIALYKNDNHKFSLE